MKKIFIDGDHGVAGYSLKEKLQPFLELNKIKLINIADSDIKIESSRYQAINDADIAVLCLPEEVSAKTCYDLKKSNTIIIDASTYHRTLDGWTYGYQELNSKQLDLIVKSNRIANPGCFANGILSILNPLKNYLKNDFPINLTGVTGYSAGGKLTVKKQLENPIHYRIANLNREHIHLKEVKHWLKIKQPISFMPSVSSFERGQIVSLIVFQEQLNVNLCNVKSLFKNFYNNFDTINIIEENTNIIIPEKMSGRDDLDIYISQIGNYLQINAVYDNLGKGSSGSIANIISKLI